MVRPARWSHHISGWGPVADGMLTRLHHPGGVTFYDWADGAIRDDVIDGPWAGILHNACTYPEGVYKHKYARKTSLLPLTSLPDDPRWQRVADDCVGLFTLSKHCARFLRQCTDTLIDVLTHPISKPMTRFSPRDFGNNTDKKVLFSGQWLRRYSSFAELETPWAKLFLQPGSFNNQDYKEADTGIPARHVPRQRYNELLTNNILFLDLYDASACNVVLEAIIRATPILVRKLPAVVEYLGKDYPYYFEDMDEANEKVRDLSLVGAAHRHLWELSQDPRFTHNHFIDQMHDSLVYSSFPTV